MPVIDAPAPRFCTQAVHLGKQTTVCLEDLRGKWVLILFYGNDFTFV